MKTNTLFQVRFRPSVKPPKGFTKSAHYNVTAQTDPFIGKNEYLIGNTWLPAKDFIKIEVQDAPVFQKPPLRKIASLKPDEVIECNTDAKLKSVLEQAEREGLVWQYSGRLKPTKYAIKAPNCIGLSDIQNGCIAEILLKDAIAGNYTILPASKFVEVEAEPEAISEAQKDECVKLQERIKELEALCELRQQDIDCLCEDNEAKIEQSTELSKRIDELRDICLLASNTGSKAIMYSVLRAIANGEI